MRLKALLFAAGLAVASAGTAAASPTNTCEGKTWIAKLVCQAQRDAQARLRAQAGKSTMISSSARPSTSPAATAPSEATRRKDGAEAGARSP